MKLKCDAVFEGGGVRGIGHVGAASALEHAGYRFENLVGSSAGAIVASLLAAGYSTDEIKQEIESLDYLKFKQEGMLSRCFTIGKLLSASLFFGIYDADYFEDWLSGLLARKGKTCFGDLKIPGVTEEKYQYKLQVTASDLTGQRLLIFPRDLAEFGLDPDQYSIAKAVRMSMSIPMFYKPFRLPDARGKEHYIVDGGLLSNYPVWILDDGTSNPPCPTFGFKFLEDTDTPHSPLCCNPNIIDYLKALLGTMLDASDNLHISKSKGDWERTILIPVTIAKNGQSKKIGATDFDISQEESQLLFKNGVQAGKRFLSNWNFQNWKLTYRSGILKRLQA